MSWPSTVTVPALGVTMPHTMLISVVLPAPFGPSRAKISPFWISRLVLCRACTPDLYDLVRFWIEMMGAMGPRPYPKGRAAPIPRLGRLRRADRKGRQEALNRHRRLRTGSPQSTGGSGQDALN